jgi:hypothetical protein
MHGDHREWDEAVLSSCFLPHDIAKVRKITLLDRAEDMIAWFYEKTGLFTVQSAYKLAVELEQGDVGQEGCSARPYGSRPLYKGIWTTKSRLKYVCLCGDWHTMVSRHMQIGRKEPLPSMQRVRSAVQRMKQHITQSCSAPNRLLYDMK